MRRSLLLVLALAAAGCSGPSNDGPVGGSGSSGSKAHADAGKLDAGHADAGAADGGVADAGAGDAGIADAGPGDAGLADSGPADGGPSDAGEPDGGPLTGQVCPPGSITFPGKVVDICQTGNLGSSIPLDGVQISTLQPYSATVSSDGGQYLACLPPNQPTTLQYSMPGYLTGYLAELSVTGPLFTGTKELSFALLCSAVQQTYLQEIPQYDPKLGTVIVVVASVSGQPPCGGPHAEAGWSFTASPVDGGAGDGGPWPAGYFDSSMTLEAAGATFDNGEALVFDIGPGAQYVTLQATNDAGIGAECPTIDAALGFTGRIYVAPGSFSYEPWLVP